LTAEIGIIGGSGLYSMPGFEAQEEATIQTPFGNPSDNYILGTLAGRKVAFLARHGAGGHLYVFVHPASTGGVLLELIQESET